MDKAECVPVDPDESTGMFYISYNWYSKKCDEKTSSNGLVVHYSYYYYDSHSHTPTPTISSGTIDQLEIIASRVT